MDGFRKSGLHFPEDNTSPNKQRGLDMVSLGDEVLALTGYQAADTRLHQANNAREHTEAVDDDDSVSDLGNVAARKARNRTVIWNWTLWKTRKVQGPSKQC